LKVATLSSKKLGDTYEGKLKNNFLYNGKELLDEDADLGWLDYGFRNYDPQIGRFTQLDPLTDFFPFLTPYQYASCDPITNIDIDGLEGGDAVTRSLNKALGETANAAGKALENVVVTGTRKAATMGAYNFFKTTAGRALLMSAVKASGVINTQFPVRTVSETSCIKCQERSQKIKADNTVLSSERNQLMIGLDMTGEPHTAPAYKLNDAIITANQAYLEPYGEAVASSAFAAGGALLYSHDPIRGATVGQVVGDVVTAFAGVGVPGNSGLLSRTVQPIPYKYVPTIEGQVSNAKGVQTTLHGAKRVAGASATRGGILSVEEINTIRSLVKPFIQGDGANVFIQETSPGRYSGFIENQNTGKLITTMKNWSKNSINKMGKNHGWSVK
jgi:RHS repeat-associated protein